ncbi:hypothetical protein MLD38_019604 [Melastoma candidum]|uniref:Uncharacterized protein n=1 Tax=Melastoma candidum TaxID=119954 RepID=A0ACB9R119_9MYRT|nr:hypothetical protein MLD38_019604 [Melastoma candidum]
MDAPPPPEDRPAPQPQQRQQLLQHLMEGVSPNPNPANPGATSEATNSGLPSFSSTLSFISHDEDASRVSALNAFKLKEEEIEKRKLEIREKVMSHLGRVEEETKRLATIREELEMLSDPLGKEVSLLRKKIDTINKELKPLGHLCQKKEKEYKEALDAFNEKNKEKVQLINKLMELSSESEKVRMKKLEELSMTLQ